MQALHHPFTAPNPEDMNDLASARALAYDMVYNGVEVIEIRFWLLSSLYKPRAWYFTTDVCINNSKYYFVPIFCQIGGGSLRIYKRDIQQKVLQIVGISMEQVSNYDSILILICLFHLFSLFHIYNTFQCWPDKFRLESCMVHWFSVRHSFFWLHLPLCYYQNKRFSTFLPKANG